MNKRTKPVGASGMTVSLVAMYFMYSCFYSLMAILLGDVIEAFSLVGAEQGLSRSMSGIGAVLALFTVNFLQRYIKKPTIALLASALMGCVQFFLGSVSGITSMVILYILLGLGMGYSDSTLNSLMADIHGQNRAQYISLLHGFFGVAGFTMPYIIAALRTTLDWQGISRLIGLLGLIPVVIYGIVLLRNKSSSQSKPAPVARMSWRMMVQFVCTAQNIKLLCCMFFLIFIHSSLALWAIRYFSIILSAPEMGALAFSLFWICSTISRFVVPLFRRVTLINRMVYGLLSAGIILVICVLTKNPVIMCIGYVAYGLFGGHGIPTMMSIATNAHPENTTLATSSILLAQHAAAIVAPILIGAVASVWTLQAGMLLPALSAIISGLFAIALKRDSPS